MKSHKFIIFDGNYPDTIRAVFKLRKNYFEIPFKIANFEELNFIWKPCIFTQQVFTLLATQQD